MYCFERGATKTMGGEGWADVWKRQHFGWEYKGKRKDLNAAYAQLQQYAPALENPPLLIVSDMETFILRPNWTNSVSRPIVLRIEDLRDADHRAILKSAFSAPEKLQPEKTRQALTEEAVVEFAELARQLFRAMKDPGGMVGFRPVPWFNGGLFDDDTALPLEAGEIGILRRLAKLDWSEIDPAILGPGPLAEPVRSGPARAGSRPRLPRPHPAEGREIGRPTEGPDPHRPQPLPRRLSGPIGAGPHGPEP